MYDHRHRAHHAASSAATHAGVPGKTTLTSQLAPAPAQREEEDAEHDHDEDEELDEEAHAGEKRDDEDSAPRARAAGLGPGNDTGDHTNNLPKPHKKRKRHRKHKSKHKHKHESHREHELHKAINRIYHFRHDGIFDVMVRSVQQTTKSTILIDAIKSAVAATTAVLDPKVAILAKIFIEGAAALAKSFKKSTDPYDFVSFCEDYNSSLLDARDAAFAKAKEDMKTDPSVLTAARKLAKDGTTVQHQQATEIVTAWINVLRGSGKDPNAAKGIGHNDSDGRPLDDAALGRLDIHGLQINEDFSVDHSHGTVTTKGVPGKAAFYLRDRKLSTIPVARTLNFKQERSAPIHGAFGVNANNHTVGDTKDEQSKIAFASYKTRTMLDPANQAGIPDGPTIEANWQAGIDKLWDLVKDFTISHFDKDFAQGK